MHSRNNQIYNGEKRLIRFGSLEAGNNRAPERARPTAAKESRNEKTLDVRDLPKIHDNLVQRKNALLSRFTTFLKKDPPPSNKKQWLDSFQVLKKNVHTYEMNVSKGIKKRSVLETQNALNDLNETLAAFEQKLEDSISGKKQEPEKTVDQPKKQNAKTTIEKQTGKKQDKTISTVSGGRESGGDRLNNDFLDKRVTGLEKREKNITDRYHAAIGKKSSPATQKKWEEASRLFSGRVEKYKQEARKGIEKGSMSQTQKALDKMESLLTDLEGKFARTTSIGKGKEKSDTTDRQAKVEKQETGFRNADETGREEAKKNPKKWVVSSDAKSEYKYSYVPGKKAESGTYYRFKTGTKEVEKFDAGTNAWKPKVDKSQKPDTEKKREPITKSINVEKQRPVDSGAGRDADKSALTKPQSDHAQEEKEGEKKQEMESLGYKADELSAWQDADGTIVIKMSGWRGSTGFKDAIKMKDGSGNPPAFEHRMHNPQGGIATVCGYASETKFDLPAQVNTIIVQEAEGPRTIKVDHFDTKKMQTVQITDGVNAKIPPEKVPALQAVLQKAKNAGVEINSSSFQRHSTGESSTQVHVTSGYHGSWVTFESSDAENGSINNPYAVEKLDAAVKKAIVERKRQEARVVANKEKAVKEKSGQRSQKREALTGPGERAQNELLANALIDQMKEYGISSPVAKLKQLHYGKDGLTLQWKMGDENMTLEAVMDHDQSDASGSMFQRIKGMIRTDKQYLMMNAEIGGFDVHGDLNIDRDFTQVLQGIQNWTSLEKNKDVTSWLDDKGAVLMEGSRQGAGKNVYTVRSVAGGYEVGSHAYKDCPPVQLKTQKDVADFVKNNVIPSSWASIIRDSKKKR